MTDNELIARFMGGVRQKCTSYSIHDYPNELPKFILKDLKYHKSWDWLMPVVEKIEEMGFEFTIWQNKALVMNDIKMIHEPILTYNKRFGSTGTAKSKIECTYQAVIEFIRWHNQQKNDSPSS